jgi:hypothetical protein
MGPRLAEARPDVLQAGRRWDARMAARDPNAQRLRPDRETQRRAEIHRLAIDTGMYRRRGKHV